MTSEDNATFLRWPSESKYKKMLQQRRETRSNTKRSEVGSRYTFKSYKTHGAAGEVNQHSSSPHAARKRGSNLEDIKTYRQDGWTWRSLRTDPGFKENESI